MEEDSDNRASVARILVNSNSKEGEEILSRLARDKDSLVREEACDSLCISKSVTTYELLKKIAEKDKNGKVRGYAIMSLGEIADRIHMQKDLEKFLDNKLINEEILFTKICIYAVLYNLGKIEYLTNLLIMINEKNYCNRCAVVERLSEVINAENKEVIRTALIERKKIEKTWEVISTIDRVLEDIECEEE